MATIRKRGRGYQAEVRRKGYPRLTKTFTTAAEAKAWVRMVEADIDRGSFMDRREAEATTLGEALLRYQSEVTVRKRSAKREGERIRKWLNHPLASRSLANLRSLDFARYRDERLKVVGASAVRLELAIISHLFTIARKEWGLPVDNPIAHIRRPAPPPGRERRLSPDEETQLLQACAQHSLWLVAAVQLAIHTGMRAGEIGGLTWQRVNLQERYVLLEQTKNGYRRIVPLTHAAAEVLGRLPRRIDGRVFPFTGDRLSRLFSRITRRAGLIDLHFHDLRHEAASRLAPHVPAPTLAKIMGWRTLQMAMRYYNPSHAELLAVVDAAMAARA